MELKKKDVLKDNFCYLLWFTECYEITKVLARCGFEIGHVKSSVSTGSYVYRVPFTFNFCLVTGCSAFGKVIKDEYYNELLELDKSIDYDTITHEECLRVCESVREIILRQAKSEPLEDFKR